MGDTLRYGIIGTGMMGIEHLLNLKLVDGAEAVAFADPDEGSRKWGRDTAGEGVAELEDHRTLLDRDDVDAVVVCTPNHTHRAVLADCFASGKHILVEKPLCTTVEDAQWVVEQAESYDGVVWVGMEYRYMPPVARMIDEIRGGTIGQLRMLAIREHRFPFLPKVGNWNRFARNTGGTLVEKCCHFFDLMNHIVGERAIRVFASGAQDVNHLDESYDGETPDILDNAFVVVDYESGARALLDLCMFAEASRNQEEISAVGADGKVECFVPKSEVVIGRRSWPPKPGEWPPKIETIDVPVDERILKAGGHHGSTYYQHLGFLGAVRNGTAPEVSARDGMRAVALGAAAEASAKSGEAIAVDI